MQIGRNSTAYSEDGREVAAHEPLSSDRLVATGFALSEPTGQGISSTDVWLASAVEDDFGIGLDSSGRLYHTTDGSTFTWFDSASADGVEAFRDSSGTANCFVLDGSNAVWVYSDVFSGAHTETRCQLDGSDFTLPNDGFWQPQSIHRLGSGTLIMGLYANPETPTDTYIYRSTDDGLTWTTAATISELSTAANNHIHSVGSYIDPDTGAEVCLAVNGDGGTLNRRWWYSTDDGQNWSLLWSQPPVQPMRIFDLGSGWVRCCSDSEAGVFDVYAKGLVDSPSATPRIRPLDLGWDRQSDSIYSWLAVRKGEDWYLCGYDTTQAGEAAISVYREPFGAVTLWHAPSSHIGVRRLYSLGGILAGTMHDSDKSPSAVEITIPDLTVRRGLTVTDAATNELPADVSRAETTGGSFDQSEGSGSTLSAPTASDAWIGSRVIRVERSNSGYLRWASEDVTPVADDPYVGWVVLRGYGAEGGYVTFYQDSVGEIGSKRYFTLSERWTPLYIPAATPGNTNNLRLRVHVGGNDLDVDAYVEIGALQILAAATPQPWQVGGTPRRADVAAELVAQAQTWSDSRTLWPMIGSAEVGDDREILRYEAADSAVVVDWDQSADQFRLTATTDGTDRAAVTSAATRWLRHSQITLQTELDADGDVTVTITNGSETITLSDAAGATDLIERAVTLTAGNLPGVWERKEDGFGNHGYHGG